MQFQRFQHPRGGAGGMNIKQALHILLRDWKYPRLKWHMFEVTINAVAGGNPVLIGRLDDYAPSGYAFVGPLLPYVLNGTDTSIFNNSPELLHYDSKLYVKTYKNVNNVKMQFYGIVARK